MTHKHSLQLCFFLGFLLFAFFSIRGAEGRVKMGWIFNSDTTKFWTYEQDRGRNEVQDLFKDDILTTSMYSVDESDPIASRDAILSLLNTDHKVIFATSSGFFGPAKELAPEYPDRFFVLTSGTVPDGIPNVIVISPFLHQLNFFAGMLAGLVTQTNKIGAISGFVDNPFKRDLNSFKLGLLQTNPNATVSVLLLFSWTDERLHGQATNQLIDDGHDIILQFSGSPVISQIVASRSAEEGTQLRSLGFPTDLRTIFGPTVYISLVYKWSVAEAMVIESYLNGTLAGPLLMNPGIVDGTLFLSPASELVPSSDEQFVLDRMNRAIATLKAHPDREVFFCGAQYFEGVTDLLGNPVVVDPETGCLTPEQIAAVDYTLPGIVFVEGEFFFNDVYLESDDPAYIALMAVISFCAFMTLVYVALVFYYIKTPVIVYASPIFCFIILFGGCLEYVSAYLHLQEPDDFVCSAARWFEAIGLTLMLSSIIVKNFRVFQIYRAAEVLKKVKMPNSYLLTTVLILTLFMTAIMIAWQVVAPLEASYVNRDEDNAADLSVDERYLQCDSDDYLSFYLPMILYEAALLLVAAVLAWLTRSVHMVFNESSMIALSVYNIILLEIITQPLIETFDDDQYVAKTVLMVITPMYRGFSTVSLIIGYKLFIALFRSDENTKMSLTTSSPAPGSTASRTYSKA